MTRTATKLFDGADQPIPIAQRLIAQLLAAIINAGILSMLSFVAIDAGIAALVPMKLSK